jgi:hypothetical protein
MEKLLRENLLPRLDNMENELRELREATWPYCQAQRDGKSVFHNMREKRTLLRWLQVDEIRKLLRRKAYWMNVDPMIIDAELKEILVDSNV